MLGIDGRAARAAFTVLLVAATAVLLYRIRHTILVLILAMLLAYLLAPLARLAERVGANRIPRGVALAVIYVLFLTAAGWMVGGIGSRIALDATELARKLPQYVHDSSLPLPSFIEPYRNDMSVWVKEHLEPEARNIMPLVERATQQLMSMAGNILLLIVVPVMSFFLLKDGERMRALLIEAMTLAMERPMAETLLDDTHYMLSGYMRAMLILALMTFVCFYVFLAAAGIPNAAALSAVAGVAEFVPAAGPLTTGAAILFVAAVSGSPKLGLVLIFLAVYRLVLDYVILPKVMSRGVMLPPVAVLFGILAGEQIAGVTGMFLSIPFLAAIRVVWVCYRRATEQA